MVKIHNIDSGLTQKDWVGACKKLGLNVRSDRGHGSHARVYHPGGNKATRPITLQRHITKRVSQDNYKKLLSWGFTEEQIDEALK